MTLSGDRPELDRAASLTAAGRQDSLLGLRPLAKVIKSNLVPVPGHRGSTVTGAEVVIRWVVGESAAEDEQERQNVPRVEVRIAGADPVTSAA